MWGDQDFEVLVSEGVVLLLLLLPLYQIKGLGFRICCSKFRDHDHVQKSGIGSRIWSSRLRDHDFVQES